MKFFRRTSFFILFFCFSGAFQQAYGFRVVLDPGHGGTDLGASRDSFVEKKIVLSIAEKMQQILSGDSLDVTLTRRSDANLSLQQRVELANEMRADLFVSLHANSSTSSLISGFEFYFASPSASSKSRASARSPLKNTSAARAEDIVEKIKKDLIELGKQKSSLEFSKQTQAQIANQKSVIRRAPFYVIENTDMPAVLIEVGFISNRREAKRLASPEYQSEIATLLANSILNYKEKSDKKQALNEK